MHCSLGCSSSLSDIRRPREQASQSTLQPRRTSQTPCTLRYSLAERPKTTIRQLSQLSQLGDRLSANTQRALVLPRSVCRHATLTVRAERHKSLFVPKFARENQSREDALGQSLYVPNPKLPPEGKTRLREDETCDPMTRSCQTPMHIWESQCRACSGTGEIRSFGRGGKRSTSTCPLCSGLGILRRTSSRINPDISGGNNGKTNYTLARALKDEYSEDTDDQYMTSRTKRR